MYEPLILEKKKPRTISGTPAAKVYGTFNFLKIFAFMGGFFLISNYILRRKQFVAELDEVTLSLRGSSHTLNELEDTKAFWNSPTLEGVVSIVRKKISEQEKLIEDTLRSDSPNIENK